MTNSERAVAFINELNDRDLSVFCRTRGIKVDRMAAILAACDEFQGLSIARGILGFFTFGLTMLVPLNSLPIDKIAHDAKMAADRAAREASPRR